MLCVLCILTLRAVAAVSSASEQSAFGSMFDRQLMRRMSVSRQAPITPPCPFMNRSALPAACWIEHNSRTMVRKWVHANDTVLEIGARYGSVSCTIAEQLNQSGKVLSVEPDSRVWDALTANLFNQKCHVKVFRGSMGTHALEHLKVPGSDGYGTEFVPSEEATTPGPGAALEFGASTVPHKTFDELQRQFGLNFNVAEIDCEGCLPTLLKDNPGMTSHLRLIIVESHNPTEEAAVQSLLTKGFKMVDQFSRQRVLMREDAKTYSVGEQVQIRDPKIFNDNKWRHGVVTSVTDGKVSVRPKGWVKAYTWDEIRGTSLLMIPSSSAADAASHTEEAEDDDDDADHDTETQ